jgi:predicted O-methyltransferase YrrM
MSYISQSLTFEEDKIYYTQNGREYEVMMDWEDTLMSSSAAYVTQNGGDILEIGFGMGISAGYIQSASISSHTIIENHPQVIPLAQAWASDKPNVTIVTGSWYENLNHLLTYDGVFHDTYGDADLKHFSSSLSQLVKTGGVVTWWNTLTTSSNYHNIPNVEYQEFEINPPQNSYFNYTKYFMPKKQF